MKAGERNRIEACGSDRQAVNWSESAADSSSSHAPPRPTGFYCWYKMMTFQENRSNAS